MRAMRATMRTMRKTMFAATLAVGLVLVACGTPSDVRDKIALEASIHDGYERLVVDGASREDVVRMLRASGNAWRALDRAVNHDGEAAGASSAAVTSRDPGGDK